MNFASKNYHTMPQTSLMLFDYSFIPRLISLCCYACTFRVNASICFRCLQFITKSNVMGKYWIAWSRFDKMLRCFSNTKCMFGSGHNVSTLLLHIKFLFIFYIVFLNLCLFYCLFCSLRYLNTRFEIFLMFLYCDHSILWFSQLSLIFRSYQNLKLIILLRGRTPKFLKGGLIFSKSNQTQL